MLNQPLAWAVFHYHDNYGMGVWVGSCSKLMTEGVRSKLDSQRKVGKAAPHPKRLVKQNDIERIAFPLMLMPVICGKEFEQHQEMVFW